jgi:regulator of cell morphogenesis and NO signaling
LQADAKSKIGQIATEYPLATRVFARHGIDFCCGGGKPLGQVCEQKGIEVAQVIAEIEKEVSTTDEPQVRWDQAPLEALIEHILDTYHAPLREELPRLEAMAEKVLKVHGDKDPEMFSGLVRVFAGLKNELDQHMAKEEQILFPMILSGQGASASGPVSVMEQEHDSAGEALRRIRELTHDYQVPDEACTTWRALWHGLAELEAAMHRHIHLENNILFPRALAETAV